MNDEIKCKGDIEAVIDYLDGSQEILEWHNTVLVFGRAALASSLANQIGTGPYNFFIARMIFGDGGTSGGVPKYVNSDRNGLFGTTRANKPVIATVDPLMTSTVTLTSVLTNNDANGYTLNEMALVMNTGNLYSMATFADLSKSNAMQITWNWRISFV